MRNELGVYICNRPRHMDMPRCSTALHAARKEAPPWPSHVGGLLLLGPSLLRKPLPLLLALWLFRFDFDPLEPLASFPLPRFSLPPPPLIPGLDPRLSLRPPGGLRLLRRRRAALAPVRLTCGLNGWSSPTLNWSGRASSSFLSPPNRSLITLGKSEL